MMSGVGRFGRPVLESFSDDVQLPHAPITANADRVIFAIFASLTEKGLLRSSLVGPQRTSR